MLKEVSKVLHWIKRKITPTIEVHRHIEPTPIDPLLAAECERLVESNKRLQDKCDLYERNFSTLRTVYVEQEKELEAQINKYNQLKEAIELAKTIQFKGDVTE